MEKKILYNFASRSRPHKFFACLDNIREMSNSKNYIIVAKLDTNDHSDYSRLKDYPEVIPVFGFSRNKVDAINRGDLLQYEWDIICNHSDDMWFTVKGYDDIIREAFKDEEDIFVHFPDQQVKTLLCTYSMMDRNYFKRTGYIYHPTYVSLWCDNEAHQVAVLLDRYRLFNVNILEHRHPMNGFGEMDMQYKITERFYHIDRVTFERRKQKNFGL